MHANKACGVTDVSLCQRETEDIMAQLGRWYDVNIFFVGTRAENYILAGKLTDMKKDWQSITHYWINDKYIILDQRGKQSRSHRNKILKQ